jgi:hypothetical protein
MKGNDGVDPVESQNADNGEQGRPEGRDTMKNEGVGVAQTLRRQALLLRFCNVFRNMAK